MSYRRNKNKLKLSCYKSRQEDKIKKICESVEAIYGDVQKKKTRGRPRKRPIEECESSEDETLKSRKVESDVAIETFDLNIKEEGNIQKRVDELQRR